MVRSWPLVPGIDLAGTVAASRSADWKPGDKVVVTGWGLGENHWGGLAQRAEAALKAGCDVVLQCSGVLADMEDVVAGCRVLDGLALVRARAAERFAKAAPESFDIEQGWQKFAKLRKEGDGAVA